MEKPSVYFLFSFKDRKTYVGSTPLLSIRLIRHAKGQVAATIHRRPLKLIYQEEFNTLGAARTREKYYKTAAGRRRMKKILSDLGVFPGSPASP